jgi:hypothetical protein
MMAEAASVVTITAETKEETLEVLAEDVMAKEVRVQEAVVSDLEVIVQAQVVKADLKVQLHVENQVRFKEKKELQDVRKEVRIVRLVVHSKLQKTEDQEEVNTLAVTLSIVEGLKIKTPI